MNSDKYFEAKQELQKKLGKEYPTCREEISPRFLISFADYLPSPDEDDYEDYREYEKEKYASEQWAFIWKMTPATAALMENREAGKAACEEFLNWVEENYFPEFKK